MHVMLALIYACPFMTPQSHLFSGALPLQMAGVGGRGGIKGSLGRRDTFKASLLPNVAF